MITFPFYCPSCNQMANAAADPGDLLFVAMGRQGLIVTCENCETKFSAIVNGDSVSLGAEVEGEETP